MSAIILFINDIPMLQQEHLYRVSKQKYNTNNNTNHYKNLGDKFTIGLAK